jgi:hypothetical protein
MILNETWRYQDRFYSARDGEEFVAILPKVIAGSRLRAEYVE